MKNKLGVIFALVGMVFGVVMIILGFVAKDWGSYADYATFGGDFYTYSYRASRYAANNLIDVIDAIGFVIISMGLFDIAFFGCKLAGFIQKDEGSGGQRNGSENNDAEAIESPVWNAIEETPEMSEQEE